MAVIFWYGGEKTGFCSPIEEFDGHKYRENFSLSDFFSDWLQNKTEFVT